MSEVDATIQPEGPQSFDEIAAAVIADMDAPAPEPETAGAVPALETPAGAAPEPAPVADAAAEAGTTAEAESTDFLQASGVTLEELLEGVEDPQARSFIESRYKQMQGHFSKRTAEAAESIKAKSALEQQNADLLKRLEALEAQRPTQAPPVTPEQAQAQASDWRQRYIMQGIDKLITADEAVTDPALFAAYVEQVATIKAREMNLQTMGAVDQRLRPVEQMTYQQALAETQQTLTNLFAPAPEYRTPQVEEAMGRLIDANPGITLEQAFEIVVGPQMRGDAYRLGQTVGTVAARKTAEERAGLKARVSVPSSGASGDMGPELSDHPSIDEAWEHAGRTLAQG